MSIEVLAVIAIAILILLLIAACVIGEQLVDIGEILDDYLFPEEGEEREAEMATGIYTEKDNKTVSILGTDYSIKFVPEEELHEVGADGATDVSTKLIRVGVFIPQKCSIGELSVYQRKVLRHELIHAFLYESGLWECSGSVDSWANNETMVDFFAYQHGKLHALFEKAGAL